jgi:hypothetical protein
MEAVHNSFVLKEQTAPIKIWQKGLNCSSKNLFYLKNEGKGIMKVCKKTIVRLFEEVLIVISLCLDQYS